jgi:hypothetical protein
VVPGSEKSLRRWMYNTDLLCAAAPYPRTATMYCGGVGGSHTVCSVWNVSPRSTPSARGAAHAASMHTYTVITCWPIRERKLCLPLLTTTLQVDVPRESSCLPACSQKHCPGDAGNIARDSAFSRGRLLGSCTTGSDSQL